MADSDLIRGNVDTIILKVLYEGDRYGYDMIKQINARSGGQWEIKQPTLYACLKRLEKQGFVKSYWDESDSAGGKRKYYTLTESGKQVFISYKTEFERTRDLFGSLISDDDAMLPVDDFSDVEEDSYAIPKRRPSRPRERAVKTEADKPVTPAEVVEQKTEETVEETAVNPEPEVKEIEKADEEEFVQASFFDAANAEQAQPDTNAVTDNAEAVETVEETEPDYVEKYKQTLEDESSAAAEKRVTEPSDPREILDRMHAVSYNEEASFFGSRDRNDYAREPVKEYVAAPTVKAPAEPVKKEPAIAPAPAPTTAPAVSVNESLVPLEVIGGESLARREYKDILSDLVDRCEKRGATTKSEQTATADAPAIEVKRFDDVVRSVTELGNEVSVRDHNDSAKVYTRKYYYYSNRLMMTHYTIMCATMFLLGLITFLTCYLGLQARQRYDYILYILCGLLPIIIFIAAVIVFAGEPDKRKRISVNFRFSFIIRFVIMLQVLVIIYCFNLIWGMPVSFSADYIPSLLLPAVYALFIPISEAIFMTLLKSGRYAVE